MINLDFSLVVTVIYVLALYLFLSRVFFRPLHAVMSERRRLTQGRSEDAASRLAAVASKMEKYDQSIRDARAEAYRRQEMVRQAALDERVKIVADARVSAERTVVETQGRIQWEAEEAAGVLQSRVDDLAKGLAQSILRN